MKHITIENAKTRLFESKEHYLNFKQAWKDFHNSDKLVWRDDVEIYVWSTQSKGVMKNVKHTSLSAEHYMLYNLLRGYSSERGFREDSDHGWTACEYALWQIDRTAKWLKDVNDTSYERNRKTAREMFETLTLPFGGTVTQEMIYQVGKEITEQFYGNDSSLYFDFEIEDWKTEEQIAAENFREDLKAPKRNTLKERLKNFAIRSN